MSFMLESALIKKFLHYGIIIFILLAIGSYFYYINMDRTTLKQELENKTIEAEVKEDEIKTESFEAKWEATEPKKEVYNYEIKEKNSTDANSTTYSIQFLKLQSKN